MHDSVLSMRGRDPCLEGLSECTHPVARTNVASLLERYVAEPDSDVAERYLLSDRVRVTARHTRVEVRRNLARLLSGKDLALAQRYFADDLRRTMFLSWTR